MLETRKITAHLPAKLLNRAQRATGEGITETIRRGLEMVAAAKAAHELRQMRGKVHLSIDVADLRRDRR